MAVTYKRQSIGFGRLGVEEYLPAELLVDSAGRREPFLPTHLPPVLLPDVPGSMPWLRAFLVLTAILLGMFMLVPIFRTPDVTLSYAYPLYGLTLMLVAAVMVYLLELDSEWVSSRIGYPRGKEDQYCLRWDYRRPAEFVNANLGPEDIVISAQYGVRDYLGRDVYLVSPTDRVLP